MCSPILALGAVAAATSVAGTVMSSNAQKANANAIAQQNYATTQAQNQGFIQRMQAQQQQTAAQSQVEQQTMADRFAAVQTMRQQQTDAMNQQQQVLGAENQQADAIRANADRQAQNLVQQTSAQNLQGAQQSAQQQAAQLLAAADPNAAPGTQGPQPTDPTADNVDAATHAALARRAAVASSNVRDYGQKVATMQSYQQPLADVQDAITQAKIGIMPAQQAAQLLQSGSNVRLLPSQVGYTNAGILGGAMDSMIQSRGQAGLNLAGLESGDATALANLQQSDATTIAANQARQAQANAQYASSLGGLVSGIGNLGLYGSAYYGGTPSWLKPSAPAVA